MTSTQFQLLYALLSQNSTLLFAAYSVAVSASDSEYFAEICKDLANSLTTEQGRSACEAQDEVLQVCDQLYLNSRITENQLLYLRHLVLIRDEDVATVYDEFQEHQSVPLLAKSLYELANSHPFQQVASEKSVGTENDDEEEEEEDDVTESSAGGSRKKSMANISKGLTGVISLMSRAGVISKTEANVLFEMVEEENDYVIAAYELYEKDRNLDDLQDTLLRCVRLEIRKRVTDIQEKELANLQRERQQQQHQYDNDDEDEEDEGDFRSESEEEEEESPSGDNEEDDFGLEDITLDSILQSLNIENIWKDMVPDTFVHAVFIAVIRGYLEENQAKACCDLFMARYDLVLAAWEVYTVQRDTTDFVDTLRRVVKDLNLNSLHHKAKTTGKPASPAKASQPSPATDSTKSSPTKSPNAAAAPAQDADTKELQDRKNEAMKAVMGAKRELLKHSLEMMVKQGITNAERASDLYARYLAGDALIDAAIESYANDRDVAEFLDTLQILCNNSKEDIEALMHAASASQEEEADQQSGPKSPSNEDIALLQITDIVKEMLKNDMIGPSVAEAFQGLIKSRDSRLIAAYNQYLLTKNGADLVDTLLRTVIASVEGVAKSAPSKPAPAAKPAAAEAQSSSDGLLDPSDQKTVVEILLRARAITNEQNEHLNKLIDQRNPDLARVFTRYEQTKDVHQLINTLKEFNAPNGQRTSPAKANAATATGDLEDDNEENDDDYEDEEEDAEEGEEFDEVSIISSS